MALPDPERGLVVRYDFLCKHEHEEGRDHGRKDRPCAIVLVAKPDRHGRQKVLVCPITHSEPEREDEAIAIPGKVARALMD